MPNKSSLPTAAMIESLRKKGLTRRERTVSADFDQIQEKFINNLSNKGVSLSDAGASISGHVDNMVLESPKSNSSQIRGDISVLEDLKSSLASSIENQDERTALNEKIDAAIGELKKQIGVLVSIGRLTGDGLGAAVGIGLTKLTGNIGLGFAVPFFSNVIKGRREQKKEGIRKRLEEMTGTKFGLQPRAFPEVDPVEEPSRPTPRRSEQQAQRQSTPTGDNLTEAAVMARLLGVASTIADDTSVIRTNTSAMLSILVGTKQDAQLSAFESAEQSGESRGGLGGILAKLIGNRRMVSDGGSDEPGSGLMGLISKLVPGFVGGATPAAAAAGGSVAGGLVGGALSRFPIGPTLALTALLAANAYVWTHQDQIEDFWVRVFMKAMEPLDNSKTERLLASGENRDITSARNAAIERSMDSAASLAPIPLVNRTAPSTVYAPSQQEFGVLQPVSPYSTPAMIYQPAGTGGNTNVAINQNETVVIPPTPTATPGDTDLWMQQGQPK